MLASATIAFHLGHFRIYPIANQRCGWGVDFVLLRDLKGFVSTRSIFAAPVPHDRNACPIQLALIANEALDRNARVETLFVRS